MIPAPKIPIPEAFVSVGHLAQELGVARQRVHRMVQAGLIQAVKIGPHRLIAREEAERILASSKRVSRADGRTMIVFTLPAYQDEI